MIKIIFSIILGYLLGSIPFALVIGKVFYKTDIRQSGSGNLGGTNAGRILGKKAGIAVIVCDVLKVVLAFGLASLVSEVAAILTGLACCIGHCYPIFANFKGGKAVSTIFGFLLSCAIFVFQDPWSFAGPFLMFFLVLYLFKYVSLASICGALYSSIFITSEQFILKMEPIIIIICSWLMTLLVIYRHKENMKRIKEGCENKISWM